MTDKIDRQDLEALARAWIAKVNTAKVRNAIVKSSASWAHVTPSGLLVLDEDVIGLGRSLAEYIVMAILARAMSSQAPRLYEMYMTAYMPDWRDRAQELMRIVAPKEHTT